ncbi:MAG: PDZ domain-containing protein, partial [Anaerolineae bacterium]|nr:PDZ domain-containing protein [Anaerolineae bacterium]
RNPWVGISGATISPAMVEALDLPVETGVLIYTVEPDSPAEAAGLQGGNQQISLSGTPVTAGGDILVAIEGTDVTRFDDLVNYLASNTSVGDTITLTILRSGERMEVPVTLQERPSDR